MSYIFVFSDIEKNVLSWRNTQPYWPELTVSEDIGYNIQLKITQNNTDILANVYISPINKWPYARLCFVKIIAPMKSTSLTIFFDKNLIFF